MKVTGTTHRSLRTGVNVEGRYTGTMILAGTKTVDGRAVQTATSGPIEVRAKSQVGTKLEEQRLRLEEEWMRRDEERKVSNGRQLIGKVAVSYVLVLGLLLLGVEPGDGLSRWRAWLYRCLMTVPLVGGAILVHVGGQRAPTAVLENPLSSLLFSGLLATCWLAVVWLFHVVVSAMVVAGAPRSVAPEAVLAGSDRCPNPGCGATLGWYWRQGETRYCCYYCTPEEPPADPAATPESGAGVNVWEEIVRNADRGSERK